MRAAAWYDGCLVARKYQTIVCVFCGVSGVSICAPPNCEPTIRVAHEQDGVKCNLAVNLLGDKCI